MVVVVSHAEPLPDELANSRDGPQLRLVSVGARAPKQLGFELGALGLGQPRRPPRIPSGLQRGPSTLAPRGVPLAGRRSTHAQRAYYFGLPCALLKHLSGPQPLCFLPTTVCCELRRRFHTSLDERDLPLFLYL